MKSGTLDFYREQHAQRRAAEESDKAQDTTGLRCSKCGTPPAPGIHAQAGGTHLVKRAHRFDASKRGQPTVRVASCGTWRAREPGEEG